MRGGSGGAGSGIGGGIEDLFVGVAYAKLDVADTTSYMFIDLDSTTHRHKVGTAIKLGQVLGKGFKSSSGGKWVAQLGVIIRINATDSDIAVLTGVSVALRDASMLSTPEQIVDFYPHVLDLSVVNGEFSANVTNAKILGLTEINTGIQLEDVNGDLVTPAAGDMIIRAENISGGGSFDFAFSAQYFVE